MQYIYIYIYICACVCARFFLCIYIYIYIQRDVHVRVYVCIYIYIYIHMCVCVSRVVASCCSIIGYLSVFFIVLLHMSFYLCNIYIYIYTCLFPFVVVFLLFLLLFGCPLAPRSWFPARPPGPDTCFPRIQHTSGNEGCPKTSPTHVLRTLDGHPSSSLVSARAAH